MALTEKLALLVTMDANSAVKGFNDLGKAAERNLSKTDQRLDMFATKFQKAGAAMLAGAGLTAAGLYKAGQAAGDLEQAMGGTEAVFGDASDSIDRFAKKAAQAIGLSEREFREATTSIGGQLKGLGFDVDNAADQAVNLTKIGADLAATYGGTTADAVAALGSAFRGEADPAERFNLFLNQTRVNAKAVQLGLAETTAEVSANAKAQATLALITEQSADALGGFGREADTAAGAQARMRAALEDTMASIGQGVAPIIGDLASGVGGLATKFNELPPEVQTNISKLATYGTIATGALGATSLLAGKVLEGRSRFQQLGQELPRVSRALGLVGKAASTLGPLFLLDELEPLGFLNESTPALEDLEKALSNLTKDRSIEGLGLDFDKLGASLERVTDPSVATRISDTAHSFASLGGLADFGKDSDLDKAKDQIQLLDQALANLALRDPTTASQALNEVAERLGIRVGDLVPKLKAYGETLTVAEIVSGQAAKGLDGLGGAASKAGTDITALRTKFDELTASLRGSIDADFAYEESIDAAESALQRLAEANGLVIDADNTRAEKLEAIDDATRGAKRALLDQADAAAEAAAQAYEFAGQTLTATEKQQIFRDKLAELAGDLAPGSTLRSALDGTITRLDEFAKDRKTTLQIEILESRVALAGKRDEEHFSRRAIGGPVSAGSSYLVNEFGPLRPEIFTPSVNGTVMPQGMRSMEDAMGYTFNITINNPIQESSIDSIRKIRRTMMDA